MSSYEYEESSPNSNRPPPLQPAALTRSDGDGMYVAVGPSAFSRPSNNHNPHVVESPPPQNSRPTPGEDYTRDGNNNGEYYSNQEDVPAGGRDSYYYSQPVNHNEVRPTRDPYTKNKIDYSISANVSKFRHNKIMMHDNEEGNDDDFQDNNNHNNNRRTRGGDGEPHHDRRSPSSARSTSSSLNNIRFPYATGNVRYGQKQHWLAGYTTDCLSHAPTCLDAFFCLWCTNGMQWRRLHAKPGDSSRFEVFYGGDDDVIEDNMNRRYMREGGNHDDGRSSGSNDDEENDPRFRSAASENIFDKCERIDWACCALSFFVDLLTFPFTTVPMGTAVTQYHTRKTIRVRYNLVDAPGSASEEERTQMRVEKAKRDAERKERAKKEAERDSFEKKFGKQKPTPTEMDNQSDVSSFNYKFSKKETNNNNAQEKNKKDSHQEKEPGFFASLCGSSDNNKNGSGEKKNDIFCSSDELKEFFITIFCTCCSTAQAQRELTMRGEWPGGYWSKPMKVRADLAPGRGVREALRLMDSMSPARQHRMIENAQPSLQSTARGGGGAAPVNLAQPPPTPNDNRYQGSGPASHMTNNNNKNGKNKSSSNNSNRGSNNNNSNSHDAVFVENVGSGSNSKVTSPNHQQQLQQQSPTAMSNQNNTNNHNRRRNTEDSYSPEDRPLKPTPLGIRDR